MSLGQALLIPGLGGGAATPFAMSFGDDPMLALWTHGQGVNDDPVAGAYVRIPILQIANDGSYLSMCGDKGGLQDDQTFRISMKRSTDKGLTWSERVVLASYDDVSPEEHHIANGTPIVNANTGRVHYLYSYVVDTGGDADEDDMYPYHISSDDHGVTWSAGTDLSAIKETTWKWIIFGPAHGLYVPTGYTLPNRPYIAWSPADLDNKTLWLDTSAVGGMWKENISVAAVTLADADEDTVGMMRDSSSRGMVCGITSDDRRPLLRSSVGQNSYLFFDGNDDLLSIGQANKRTAFEYIWSTAVFSILLWYRSGDDADAGFFFGNANSSAHVGLFFHKSAADTLRFYIAVGTSGVAGADIVTTDTVKVADGWVPILIRGDGSTVGVTIGEGTEQTDTMSSLVAANQNSFSDLQLMSLLTANYNKGDIAHVVFTSDRVTDAEWANYKSYNPERSSVFHPVKILEWDVSDATTRYTDTAKTDLADTAGDAVRVVENKAHPGWNDGVASSDAARPLLDLTTENAASLYFDGTGASDLIWGSNVFTQLGGSWTAVFVFRNIDATNGSHLWRGSSAGYLLVTGKDYSGNAARNGVAYTVQHDQTSGNPGSDLQETDDETNVIVIQRNGVNCSVKVGTLTRDLESSFGSYSPLRFGGAPIVPGFDTHGYLQYMAVYSGLPEMATLMAPLKDGRGVGDSIGGRLIAPMDHRDSPFTDEVSGFGAVMSDDDGAEWFKSLHSTDVANNGANESCIAALNDGTLVAVHRIVESGRTMPDGGLADEKRGLSVSIDNGGTWTNVVDAGIADANSCQVTLLNVQGSLLFGTCGNANATADRTGWKIYSTNVLVQSDVYSAGAAVAPTWSYEQILKYGFGAYADIQYDPSTKQIVGAIEVDWTTNAAHGYTAIQPFKCSLEWLQSDTYVPWWQWDFNENVFFGVATPPVEGAIIMDRGPHGDHGVYFSAASPPVYAANGITVSSVNDNGARLGVIRSQMMPYNGGIEISVQAVVTIPTEITDGVIWSNRLGASVGDRGFRCELTSSKVLFSVGSTSYTYSVTSTEDVPKDTPVNITCIRDFTISPGTIRLFVDGVEAASAVATTGMTAAQTMNDLRGFFVGRESDGSNPISMTVHTIRIDRGVVEAGDQVTAATYSPPTYAANRGLSSNFAVPSGNSPDTYSGLRLWQSFGTWANGYRAFQGDNDATDAFSHPGRVPPRVSESIISTLEFAVERRVEWGGDTGLTTRWKVDDPVAPLCAQPHYSDSTKSSKGYVIDSKTADSDNFDFLHDPAVGTLVTVFKRTDDTKAVTIWDNGQSTSSVDGFTLYINTSDAIVMTSSEAPSNLYVCSDTIPGIAFDANEWWFIAAVLTGDGNLPKFYAAKLTQGGTLTAKTSATAIVLPGSPLTIADNMTLFGKSITTAGADQTIYILESVAYDEQRTLEELQAIYDWIVDNDTNL